jgi:hypothetical protein
MNLIDDGPWRKVCGRIVSHGDSWWVTKSCGMRRINGRVPIAIIIITYYPVVPARWPTQRTKWNLRKSKRTWAGKQQRKQGEGSEFIHAPILGYFSCCIQLSCHSLAWYSYCHQERKTGAITFSIPYFRQLRYTARHAVQGNTDINSSD